MNDTLPALAVWGVLLAITVFAYMRSTHAAERMGRSHGGNAEGASGDNRPQH